MIRKFIFLFLFFTSMGYSTNEINITQKDGIEFEAKTNIFVTVKGSGAFLNGNINMDNKFVSGNFSVKLDDFKTGDDSRDEHLKKTFDVEKHPIAIFKFENVPYKEGDFPFSGDLSLKGKSKPINGICSKNQKKIECNFEVKQSDYGLKIPESIATKLGAKVNDTIKCKAIFSL